MLVILTVADVTAILGAIVNGMLLQLSHGLPDDNLTTVLPALVRELAEVNTVLEHLVDWLKEVTSLSTAWATLIVPLWHFISFSGGSSVDRGNVLLSLLNRQSFKFFFWNHLNSWIGKIVLIMWCRATHHLRLAVLTKQLVALSAFSWQQWSSTADDTLDFFNHLFLQFVCDQRYFNIQRWEWLWSHDFFDGLVGDEEFEILVVLPVNLMTTWVSTCSLL